MAETLSERALRVNENALINAFPVSVYGHRTRHQLLVALAARSREARAEAILDLLTELGVVIEVKETATVTDSTTVEDHGNDT